MRFLKVQTAVERTFMTVAKFRFTLTLYFVVLGRIHFVKMTVMFLITVIL